MHLLRGLCIFVGLSTIIADDSLTLSNILKVKKAMEELSCPVESFPVQKRSDENKNGPTALPLVLEER